ncbi:MAG: 4Fe-4S dicluster domain-containing protein [Candidatus Nealsonbacteria bacterium]|nr:4Fe-4S dicluster domain-containing protein [Candidatus Nealsonbacteria bacterium]
MVQVLEKKQINDFLAELGKKFEIIDARNDILPPKQYFFPPKEEIFTFDKKSARVSIPKIKKDFIIFGLSLPDLEAMVQLDEIMRKPQEDFFYFQRRNRAYLIGLSEDPICLPPVCALPGGDMILEKINEGQYRVLTLTDKGKKIAKSRFLKSFKNIEIKKYPDGLVPMPTLKKMLLDPEYLSDIVAWSWKNDAKIWDDLKDICLGCGICTYVCPLCYCFSVEDRNASRCRQWDACTLPNFAKISSGFNFHKTLKERYYNWFFHKFVRAYKEYGKSQCVACGRCKKYCPAGIDIEKVLINIKEDYEKYLSVAKS